jgi:polar amino acid transport system substrate-binding protein
MINRPFKRSNRRAATQGLPISACAAVTLVGACLVTIGLTAALAGGLDDIKARGHMVIATEDDFNPFEFIKDGVSTGYDNDLFNEVKKQLPFPVEQQVIPWAGILPGVTSGKYDMAMTGVLVTAVRKPTFDFASPVAQSTTFYITKAGSSVTSASELNSKTVGAQAGSAMLADLKAFDTELKAKGGPGIKQIVEYQSNPEAYQDLAIGRTDAVVNTEINLRTLLKERPGVFALGQAVGQPVYIAWALRKDNKDTLKLVDDALIATRKSGKMYELQTKWFGTTFKDMPPDAN